VYFVLTLFSEKYFWARNGDFNIEVWESTWLNMRSGTEWRKAGSRVAVSADRMSITEQFLTNDDRLKDEKGIEGWQSWQILA